MLLLLLVGVAYLVASFHPRLRFADPTPDEPLEVKRNYPCYYDEIYGDTPGRDVLYFGASKTHHAIDAHLIEAFHAAVSNEKLKAFAFDTPNSNPEIVYFMFRDYLANNPAPEMALFELTSIFPLPPPIRYIHPLFADLAPPYLYLDVLRPWSIVKHGLFAVSDFLRLFIRHIDLSLSRLLIADVRFIVPPGDNCEPPDRAPVPALENAGQYTYAQLLDAEMERHANTLDPDTIGDKAALLEAYAGDTRITDFINSWSEKRLAMYEREFWFGGRRMKERSLYYYRKIVELGREHGVDVAFYFLPNVHSPPPTDDAIQRTGEMLGAPVHTLPYRHVQVSYHFYKDAAHVKPAMRPAFAIWFASLFDQARQR